MYIALIMGIMAVGQLGAMCYDQLSDYQQQSAVNLKRSEDDRGLALCLPSGIDLIKGLIPENKEVTLPNAKGLSDRQLLLVVSDFKNLLEHCVPDSYRTGTGKITQWGFAGYHQYDYQYKSSQEILALSEEERRNAAEEKLLKLKHNNVMTLSDQYNVQTVLPVYLTVFNAVESLLYVPEIYEKNAHRLAELFLKGIDKNTLKIWLKNDQIKQVDCCLSLLTQKSHDLVLKYMNHPEMKRNNSLPADTVKQAVYLQVLHQASDETKQEALYTPEIRNALTQYTKSESLDKINQAYPFIQKIKEEAEQAWMQQIKERDKF
jgi:hypothetical protein